MKRFLKLTGKIDRLRIRCRNQGRNRINSISNMLGNRKLRTR